MDNTASFGYWLRRRRRALDLTQEALAQRVGCAVVTISKMERDELRPSRQVAERLAECLAITPDDRTTFIQVARAERAVDHLELTVEPIDAPPAEHRTTAALSGTVTFLFTDIEGSTRLWERNPQAMPVALARHETLVRQHIVAHGGHVFKTVGDAVCAVFATAPQALHAALEAQRALQAEAWQAVVGQLDPQGATAKQQSPMELWVRMALHTGAAELRDSDYFGPPLNRTSRLLAAGHGGQVLLSAAVWELVRDHLPPNVELRDLGVHQLKDLIRPEQIFQLVVPDLPADFPPLATLDQRRTNLPVQPTPFTGRE